ncbi:hypothetical protein RhiirC2_779723 [Rhizophagus irregularis]|uniref:Uncharacterized protein n=1 Tax=Rhizophagus irregularis TaxID=588596 RepID=A0A2N1N972_9GLOM|nr:hypothetical protein RhiirC2_779723 [Rhizophagus irregularis]
MPKRLLLTQNISGSTFGSWALDRAPNGSDQVSASSSWVSTLDFWFDFPLQTLLDGHVSIIKLGFPPSDFIGWVSPSDFIRLDTLPEINQENIRNPVIRHPKGRPPENSGFKGPLEDSSSSNKITYKQTQNKFIMVELVLAGLTLELGKEVGLGLEAGLDLALGYRFRVRIRTRIWFVFNIWNKLSIRVRVRFSTNFVLDSDYKLAYDDALG